MGIAARPVSWGASVSLANWPGITLSALVVSTGMCGLTGQAEFCVASTGQNRAQLQVILDCVLCSEMFHAERI